MQEEQKQNTKKSRWHLDVQEKDVGVNEEKTINRDDDLNELGKSSKSLSFREKMRGLSPHHFSLKDRLKDKTVPYIDLFRPDPPSSRRDNDTSRRMTNGSRYDRER